MKAYNIQALREALAGFSKAEAEYDDYIKNIREPDPDAKEMTIQLMGLIITYGEMLAETAESVIADETGMQPVYKRTQLQRSGHARFSTTIVSSEENHNFANCAVLLPKVVYRCYRNLCITVTKI